MHVSQDSISPFISRSAYASVSAEVRYGSTWFQSTLSQRAATARTDCVFEKILLFVTYVFRKWFDMFAWDFLWVLGVICKFENMFVGVATVDKSSVQFQNFAQALQLEGIELVEQ